MSKPEIYRIVAGVVVILIGGAIGFGSAQLWNGAPASWPDIVANNATVKNTARGMAVMAALLLVAGIATTMNLGWGPIVAATAIALFIVAAFWANNILFGDLRLMHTIPNVIVGGVIVWLLWIGKSNVN